MEFAFSNHCLTLFDRVSKRVRSVPEQFKVKKRIYYRRLLAPALLAGAALTAGLAYQMSSEDAITSWLHLHPPTDGIWAAAASSRKFIKQGDPKILQKLYRTIPSSAEASGTIWRSSDGSKIAVFMEGREGELPFRVYGATFQNLSVHWEPLGLGWPAFEQALKSMDGYLEEERKRLKNQVHHSEYVDRFEIRY